MSKTITGYVRRTEHAGTSYYGNPSYTVAIEDTEGEIHIHRTMTNSSLAYGIQNPEYREELHTFTFTPAGRIRNAVKVVTS